MDYKNILLEVNDGIAKITFNRPKVLNAMSTEVMTELAHALHACAQDDAVKALILTGSGEKAFVAGADISQMQNATPVEITKFMELGQERLGLWKRWESRRLPPSMALRWAEARKSHWPAIFGLLRKTPCLVNRKY